MNWFLRTGNTDLRINENFIEKTCEKLKRLETMWPTVFDDTDIQPQTAGSKSKGPNQR